MNDPYVYPHTDILRNFANIRDGNELSCMEAEYTSIRLAELVTKETVSRFDFGKKMSEEKLQQVIGEFPFPAFFLCSLWTLY